MTSQPARTRSGRPGGSLLGRIRRRFRPAPPSRGFGIDALHQAAFTRSDEAGYRLNLVVPTVEGARVFGGIRTAMDLFEEIAASAPDHRIVAAVPAAIAGSDAVPGYAPSPDDAAPRQLAVLGDPGAPLRIRPNDVFIATFWTTAELVARIRRWQAATYGRAPGRFGYVVQDFEPGFYPWSANSELARATYGDPAATVAVFNTSVLRDWFHGLDIRFGDEHVFEPRILPQLLAALRRPAVPRTRTILVYGRPKTPRNAFPAIVSGLRAWRAADPEGSGAWTVVSIGQGHPDVDLGGGMVLRSAGKLSLDAYADRLREAAVGVSLMVSPHPSYPPLEMAHLGMLVVTNRFGPKDLDTWHPNISSVDGLHPDTVAGAIAEACRRFEADPDAGSRAAADAATPYLSSGPQFPFAADVAAALRAGAGA